MTDKNRATDASANSVLYWSGRVLTAEGLQRALNGQREVVVAPRTVITPLARDHLRALGVGIKCEAVLQEPRATSPWSYACERPDPLVQSALQSVEREGLALKTLSTVAASDPSQWARQVAENVTRGECLGAIAVCETPALTCCIANKLRGVRAAVATTSQQTSRIMTALNPNVIAIASGGWTFFELKQVIRAVCRSQPGACPPEVSSVLEELDGYAHR